MPAADIISACGQLYRQLPATEPLTVSIGHVEDQGRFNIVGGQVVLWGTIRCFNDATMGRLRAKLTRTAEHLAQAHGATATVDYLQPVPPVNNSADWMDAALPTLHRVVGEENLLELPPALGYDDVSELINRHGGLYLTLGVQDVEIVNGRPAPIAGGRGVAFNHHPAFYADDTVLATGVRLHSHVVADHLGGALTI